jgi:hypothetical protein
MTKNLTQPKPKNKQTACQRVVSPDAAVSLAAIYGRPAPDDAAGRAAAAAEAAPARARAAGAKRGPAARAPSAEEAAGEGGGRATARPRPDPPSAAELERNTVKELQDMLRSRSLSAAGKKTALIARLLDEGGRD